LGKYGSVGGEGGNSLSDPAKVFPAYEGILSDPKSASYEVEGVFSVLYKVKADRRRFIKHALSRFTDSNYHLRWTAVWFLQSAGSPAEASPVVALLSDEHREVGYAAAKTLAAIGGPNEVVAMDVWLRGVSRHDDRKLREHVQKCRDELKKRLNEKRDSTK
jgi:HEAT repeat protein